MPDKYMPRFHEQARIAENGPLVCFDMDGVLARYERSAYETSDPVFRKPGAHYFRNRDADDRAVRALSTLLGVCDQIRCIPCIISSLTNTGSIFLEQYVDKREWIQENVPGFPIERFLPTATSKRDAAELLMGRTLRRRDILIDDFNRNLQEWRQHGGTAVKYLNGINSADSFDGPIIDPAMSAEDIVDLLCILTTK